jgi:hypothetical protein
VLSGFSLSKIKLLRQGKMSEIVLDLVQGIGEFFIFGIPDLLEQRRLRIYNQSILSDNITSIKEEQKKLGIYGQSIPLDDFNYRQSANTDRRIV